MSKGKALGPDGYSSEYYKAMLEDIIDPLEKLYTSMLKGGEYFQTGNEAYIKSNTKKG